MVNNNVKDVYTAEKCQKQCQITKSCNFWDFEDFRKYHICRLRANAGLKGKVSSPGYFYGTKNCIFSKYKQSIQLVITIKTLCLLFRLVLVIFCCY